MRILIVEDEPTLGQQLKSTLEQNGYAVDLSTVTVSGQAATKTQTPIVETPQSVSRVDRDEMDERDTRTLREAAQYTPGV